MAETRVLAPVLSLVEESGGKAILVGDPAQLPAVGAGGLYEMLCDRLGAVHLTENRRQHELAERDALSRLRDGDAESYLGHAAREGRLLVADDPMQAKERLLADWWPAAGDGDLREAVMLAHRRADVAHLNEGARALLRRAGRLGDLELVAGEREFRAGDRVICRQNDSALKVCNGTRATVRAVDPVLGLVTLQLDGGPIRQVLARYAAEHLEHGYALTGHAAQGLTIDRAFVLVRAEGALAEWGYVATSRARLPRTPSVRSSWRRTAAIRPLGLRCSRLLPSAPRDGRALGAHERARNRRLPPDSGGDDLLGNQPEPGWSARHRQGPAPRGDRRPVRVRSPSFPSIRELPRPPSGSMDVVPLADAALMKPLRVEYDPAVDALRSTSAASEQARRPTWCASTAIAPSTTTPTAASSRSSC